MSHDVNTNLEELAWEKFLEIYDQFDDEVLSRWSFDGTLGQLFYDAFGDDGRYPYVEDMFDALIAYDYEGTLTDVMGTIIKLANKRK